MPAIVDLIRRPRSFFDAVTATARPSLAGPALVALGLGGTAVVRLLAILAVLGDVTGDFSGNELVYAVGRLDVSAPQELVVATVLVLLVFVLGWLIATAITYLVARYFDPDGSFRDLLACVGWGQAPTLVPALLSTAYVLVVVARAPTITTEAAAIEWVRASFQATLAQRAMAVLDPLFALWVAGLWLLATEEALGLTRRQALVCVAVPAGLLVLNAVGGFFTITR